MMSYNEENSNLNKNKVVAILEQVFIVISITNIEGIRIVLKLSMIV